jgi:hypothetical protein
LRLGADLSAPRTERGWHAHAYVDNFAHADLVALADGTLIGAQWEEEYRDHPISIEAVSDAGGPVRQGTHGGQVRIAALDAPRAAFARQIFTAAPIDVRLSDTASGVDLASATIEPVVEGRLLAAAGAGASVWVLWSGWDAASVARGFVTRLSATSTVEEGPAPTLPEPPAPTHAIDELASIVAYQSIASESLEQIAAAPDGSVYVLGRSGGAWAVERFGADGSPSGGSFPHSFSFPVLNWELDSPARPAIATLPDGSLVVAEAGSFGWQTRRLLPTGAVDWEAEYDSGSEDYVAGLVVDENGRVVVLGSPGSGQGTPHVDCWAIRYDENGDFDDTFEVAVSENATAPISKCVAGTYLAASGQVALAGSAPITHPLLGERTGRGLARISAAGAVEMGGEGDRDLFGPILSWELEALSVAPGNLVSLTDGRLVAAVSSAMTGQHRAFRLAVIGADGASVVQEEWSPGIARIAVLEGDLLVVARQAHAFDSIHLDLARAGADGLTIVASATVELELGIGHPVAVSAGADGTFWLAFVDGSGGDMLKRFAVTAL